MPWPLTVSSAMASLSYGNSITERTDYIVEYTSRLYKEWLRRLEGVDVPRTLPDINVPYSVAVECEQLAMVAAEAHLRVCKCSVFQ